MRELRYNGLGYYDPTAYQAIVNVEKAQKGNNMDIYRGDIFFVKKAGNVTGSEQDQGRPAVVVSNDTGNEYSQIVEVVYLTTAEKKPLPTHCKVMARVPSTALCEQISNVSKERLTEYVRTCTAEEMAAIDRCLMVSLGLRATPDPTATVENAKMIDELTMKLECAERKLDKLNAENAGLMLDNADLAEQCDKLSGELQDVIMNNDSSGDMVRIETERDLYKSLYEQTFERLIAR